MYITRSTAIWLTKLIRQWLVCKHVDDTARIRNPRPALTFAIVAWVVFAFSSSAILATRPRHWCWFSWLCLIPIYTDRHLWCWGICHDIFTNGYLWGRLTWPTICCWLLIIFDCMISSLSYWRLRCLFRKPPHLIDVLLVEPINRRFFTLLHFKCSLVSVEVEIRLKLLHGRVLIVVLLGALFIFRRFLHCNSI